VRYLIFILLLTTMLFAESDLKIDPVVQSEVLFIVDNLGGDNDPLIVPGFNKVGIQINTNDSNNIGVEAAVVVEMTSDMNAVIDRAYIKWNPVIFTSIKGGYGTLPFGTYKSNLVNFPLIRYGNDITGVSQSGIYIGAETTLKGVGLDLVAYTDKTLLATSTASKISYSVKEFLNMSLSLRAEDLNEIDLDFAAEFVPMPLLSFIGEVYKGASNDKFGYYFEVGVLPTENIILSIRNGSLLDNIKDGTGTAQLSIGSLFIINDYLVAGIEWNSIWNVQDGLYRTPNYAISTLLSFSL